MSDENKNKMKRRDFLKYGSLAGAGLSLAGIAGAGLAAGKDTDSYTGWERYTHGEGQFFNRKPFFVEAPVSFQKVAPTRRINAEEQLFYRMSMVYGNMRPGRDGSPPKWNPEEGTDKLPEPLASYYKAHPNSFNEMINANEAGEIQRKNWPKYKNRYWLADAWSNAHAASMSSFPARPKGKPEDWDFKNVSKDKLKFKSPSHASQLIKKIAHTFGATLVGVAKLNPDYVYQGRLRGVGSGDFEVSKHWKNCIVVATPHEWDAFYANPTYGTSYDGYSRECMIVGKLEVFLKNLGILHARIIRGIPMI